jgi:hypothetical protein
MPALHALYSKMLAERTASRNVLSFILFYFIYLTKLTALCPTLQDGPCEISDPLKTSSWGASWHAI